MESWQPTSYKQYQWIVADPQLLGGKLAIRGTRLGVSLFSNAWLAVCLCMTLTNLSEEPFRVKHCQKF